ncbi:MAG TPA: hypothetical protein VES62_02815 [Thermoleophilaceae bacterium]|nr:hypothetical protein [Thermoleophilaceae bacterium]
MDATDRAANLPSRPRSDMSNATHAPDAAVSAATKGDAGPVDRRPKSRERAVLTLRIRLT